VFSFFFASSVCNEIYDGNECLTVATTDLHVHEMWNLNAWVLYHDEK